MDNVYNAGNQLLEDDSHIYSYNKDGNMLNKEDKASGEVTRFTYNAIREITDIKRYASALDPTPIMSAHYIYDGLRRRTLKDVDGTVTRYVYDNEDIILELDGAGTQLAYYTHGRGIDEPISMERGGSTYYYVTDALGSIVALTDNAGNTVNEYVYDSFGNMVSKTEGVTNYYTYTGREWDEESSLYYYRIRYYDSGTGRFLNQDPMGFSQGPNFYTYTGNNPVKYIDSFGTWKSTAHYDMTLRAMEEVGGYGRIERHVAATTNALLDFLSPVPDYKHFMPGTGEKAAEYIAVNLWDSALLRAPSENIDSAIFLGKALHTIQDRYSHYPIGTWKKHFETRWEIDDPEEYPGLAKDAYEASVRAVKLSQAIAKIIRIYMSGRTAN